MSFTPAPWPRRLRSQEWYGGISRDAIYHRGWMKNQGYPQRPVRRPPGHRHPEHVVRPDALQRPPARTGRKGEGGRLGSRGFSGRGAGVLGLGKHLPPDRDDVSQPRRARDRGNHSRPADGRRRAAGRLRQDHAVADDGRGVHRYSVDRRHRRADAERLFPGRTRRVRHASVEILGSREGRRDDAGRIPGSRAVDEPLDRDLQHHGHRQHAWPAWPRRWGWRCRAMRRSRPWTVAAA